MPLIEDADRELVRRCQAGDKGAFEGLVIRYQDKVFSQCFFLLNQNRQDAEDAAQEVFTSVWRGIRDFNFEAKFSTWLYTVTRNHCLNTLKRKAGNPVQAVEEILPNPSLPDERSPNERQSTEECVRSKLSMLEEMHRAVIALVHFDGLSYEEAAGRLGCPVGTIRSRLNRALEALRPLIRECL